MRMAVLVSQRDHIWYVVCAEEDGQQEYGGWAVLKFHSYKWPLFCISKFSARRQMTNFCFGRTFLKKKKTGFEGSEKSSCSDSTDDGNKGKTMIMKLISCIDFREIFFSQQFNSSYFSIKQMMSKQFDIQLILEFSGTAAADLPIGD